MGKGLKISEILRRAGELHTAHPCQFSNALNELGLKCPPRSINAVKWCPRGAVQMACGNDTHLIGKVYQLVEGAAKSIYGTVLVVDLNDSPGGIEAMPDVWSEAIEAAEAFEAL